MIQIIIFKVLFLYRPQKLHNNTAINLRKDWLIKLMTYLCMVRISSLDRTSSVLVDLFLFHSVVGAQALISYNIVINAAASLVYLHAPLNHLHSLGIWWHIGHLCISLKYAHTQTWYWWWRRLVSLATSPCLLYNLEGVGYEATFRCHI